MNCRISVTASMIILILAGLCSGVELRFTAIPVAPLRPGLPVSRIWLQRINIHEDALGRASTRDGRNRKASWAFLYQAGVVKPLYGLDEDEELIAVDPKDLTDAGHVVGHVKLTGNRYRPFHLTDRGIDTLEIGPAEHGFAIGINKRGVIVGCVGDKPLTAPRRATVWRDGQLTFLETTEEDSVACDVNDLDAIVGHAGNAALIWQGGEVRRLPELAESDEIEKPRYAAGCINNRGVIIGMREDLDNPGQGRALRWTDGTPELLPELPKTEHHSIACHLTDQGWIVGACNVRKLGYRACLWRNGDVINLNTVVDELPDGWVLAFATGINEDGVICCNAFKDGKTGSFVLMPQ